MSNSMHLVDSSNRRGGPRHPVHLIGELQLGRERPRRCTVTDVGRHGMAVATHYDHDRREHAPLPKCGQEVSIRLPLAERGKARARGFVRWAVAERHGCRFGIYFEHCNDTVFELLVGDGADLAPHIGALPRTRAVDEAGRALPSWFPALAGGFLPRVFELAQELLLEQAEDADDDEGCALYAHAAIELWTTRGQMQRTVSEYVATHLLTHPPAPGRHAALSAGVLYEALHRACKLHFGTEAHIAPATAALKRCVRECLQPPQPPRARNGRTKEEIVLEHVETAPPAGRPRDETPRNWLAGLQRLRA